MAPPMAPIKTIVTERAEGIDNPTIATTDPGDPNIHVQPMPWWQIVGVRASRVYGQSFLGLMTAGGLGLDAGLMPNDLGELALRAAQLALGPAFYSVLQNVTELLARLDESLPKLRA